MRLRITINQKWRKEQKGTIKTVENYAPRLAEMRWFQLPVNLPDMSVFCDSLCGKMENLAIFDAGKPSKWKTRDLRKTPLRLLPARDFKSAASPVFSVDGATVSRFVAPLRINGLAELLESATGVCSAPLTPATPA